MLALKEKVAVQPAHEPDCECPLCRIYRYPNKETLASFAELENGGGKTFSSLEELWRDLES